MQKGGILRYLCTWNKFKGQMGNEMFPACPLLSCSKMIFYTCLKHIREISLTGVIQLGIPGLGQSGNSFLHRLITM